MTRDQWNRIVWPVILEHEVGPFIRTGGYVDNPADPGGATKWGVSLRYLRRLPAWVGDLNGDGVVDAIDIRGMTAEQAQGIYWREWQASKYATWLERMDVELAVKVFDVRVNTGPRRAHIILQRALGPASGGQHATADDGVIGPKTRAAVKGALAAGGQHAVMVAVAAVQAEFYRDLGTGPRSQFLAGWLRRAMWGADPLDLALTTAQAA